MKELRCIVFTNREVLTAITTRRRLRQEGLPDGRVTELVLEKQPQCRAVLTYEDGAQVIIEETELLAALLSYCMGRNVPLPVESEKALHLIRGRATLIITLNFNKAARLLAGDGGAVASLT